MSLLLRWAVKRDLPVIAFHARQHNSSWDRPDLASAMQSCNNVCLALEDQATNTIMGSVFYELAPDCMRIFFITVDPNRLRRGFGRWMILKLQQKCGQKQDNGHLYKRHSIMADVPDDCLSMQLFFRKMGFKARHPNAYDRKHESYCFWWSASRREQKPALAKKGR